MESDGLATVADYEVRYGAAEDPARVEALLKDASAMLLSAYESFWGEPYLTGAHPSFDRSASAVCCAIAHRALSVPAGLAGVTQYSQTAGSYNASVTYANPTGDLYIGKSDLKRLGLSGMRIGSIAPKIGGLCDQPDRY